LNSRRKLLGTTLGVLSCLSLTACKHHGFKYPAGYHEFAYVTNGKSNSVSIIDTMTFHTLKTLAVGENPTGVAINPKKNEVYVVNTGSSNVTFINSENNEIVATVGVHSRPFFISVSEDGKRGYVANSGSANVSVLDLDHRKVLANIRVGGAPGLARVSPDGKTVVAPIAPMEPFRSLTRVSSWYARPYRSATSRKTS